MNAKVKSAASTTASSIATVFAAMLVASAEAQRPLPETPTTQRVSLAASVSGLSCTQLHAIAYAISQRYRDYGLSYYEAGFVFRLAQEHEIESYRRIVLGAISRCSDEQLTSLAVLIAGQR